MVVLSMVFKYYMRKWVANNKDLSRDPRLDRLYKPPFEVKPSNPKGAAPL